MSGIYIPGMEMPTRCCKCLLAKLSPTGESLFCNYTLSTVPWDDKPFDCPLVPVPDHGRLVDKDALEKDISESVVFSGRERNAELIGANKIINRFHRAPTIIPAEEHSPVYESLKRGLEQAINGETREEGEG